MRVWLDDLRLMPDGFDWWARTAAEAINVLATGRTTFISLDHDLAPEHYEGDAAPDTGTGHDVAKWIEEAVAEGRIKCPEWQCHSMNPSGKDRIIAAMRSAERFGAARAQQGATE